MKETTTFDKRTNKATNKTSEQSRIKALNATQLAEYIKEISEKVTEYSKAISLGSTQEEAIESSKLDTTVA